MTPKASADALDLFFVEDGPRSGPPVVLLHAFPLNHSMWDNQIPAFAGAGFRVLAPDLRGHGASPKGEGPATMARMAADVLRLADRQDLGRFVLGGLSLGGYVALEVAASRPDRLRGLLLSDTRAEPDAPEARNARVALAEKVNADGAKPLVDSYLPRYFAPATYRAQPALVERTRSQLSAARPGGSIHALLGMADRPDQRPHLRTMRMPSLVVVGAEDALTPVAAAQVLKDGLPEAQLRLIPEAGHLPCLERPDAWNQVVLEWLKRLPP